MEHQQSSSPLRKKIPVIVSDVDGVLKQRMSVLNESVIDALKIIRSPLCEIDPDTFSAADASARIPFVLLTNRGNMSEQEHAVIMNKAMSFTDTPFQFTTEENILNYSSLKPHFTKFKDQLVLLIGTQEAFTSAFNCGITKYITKQEYLHAFPEMFPMSVIPHEKTAAARATLTKRLGVTEFTEPFACAAIFVLGMPFEWEEDIQLILDLLSTEDGSVAHEMPAVGPENHIPIYVAYNDLTYKDAFDLPRLVNGGFTLSLQTTYKAVYKRDLELLLFGKPAPAQFHFAKETALKLMPEGYEASQYYMIGDNPHSDIRGANSVNWVSILVRTGMFQGKANDPIDPATHVVDDFHSAIKLIYELEGLPLTHFK